MLADSCIRVTNNLVYTNSQKDIYEDRKHEITTLIDILRIIMTYNDPPHDSDDDGDRNVGICDISSSFYSKYCCEVISDHLSN